MYLCYCITMLLVNKLLTSQLSCYNGYAIVFATGLKICYLLLVRLYLLGFIHSILAVSHSNYEQTCIW